MTAVVRSELYRILTVRSSWVSIALVVSLGLLLSMLSLEMWSLLVGLGAFTIAVVSASQHYQHRTAVLLFLGRPRRMVALAGQGVAVIAVALVLAVVSGGSVLAAGAISQFTATLAVVPLMALFGLANATIVRRPTWLLVGYSAWLIFVEGLYGKLQKPLPFSSFLDAAAGSERSLVILAGWTVVALIGAAVAISRDLAEA